MKDVTYMKKTETLSLKGDRIVLYYFVEEKKTQNNENSYAVGIDMYTQLPGERTLKERKISDAVFRNRKEAESFLDILSAGSVTPTTLSDIVEDFVIA